MAAPLVRIIFHPDRGLIEKHFSDGTSRMVEGTNVKGYRRTNLGSRKSYLIHRLIWEHVNGPIFPGYEVDHINGIRHDNRIENLRLVTRSQNNQNRHNARFDSLSGVKGVIWSSQKGKWCAIAIHLRQRYHFGFFSQISDAQAAYAKGVALLHTHNPHAAP